MRIDIYIIIIFLFIATIIRILPIKKEKRNNIFINISFVVLFIVLIIREPYSDMIEYIKFFKNINIFSMSQILNSKWEILYVALNVFIKLFTNNDRIFIIILAIIGLIGPYFFIKRYSKNYLFSVILFIILGIYHFDFYVIRQSITISILLLSIKYIEQKKLLKFLIMVLIATGFHTSALVFIIAYPICNIKVNVKWILVCSAIALTTFLASTKIINLIYSYSAYGTYMNMKNVSDGRGLLLVLIVIFIAMFIINYFNNKTHIKSTNKMFIQREAEDTNSIFFNMTMMGILFQFLSLSQGVIVRLAIYFIIGNIILIPNVICEVKDKKYKLFYCVIVLLCSLIYMYISPTLNGYKIYFG